LGIISELPQKTKQPEATETCVLSSVVHLIRFNPTWPWDEPESGANEKTRSQKNMPGREQTMCLKRLLTDLNF
jgi:hypothetical protein